MKEEGYFIILSVFLQEIRKEVKQGRLRSSDLSSLHQRRLLEVLICAPTRVFGVLVESRVFLCILWVGFEVCEVPRWSSSEIWTLRGPESPNYVAFCSSIRDMALGCHFRGYFAQRSFLVIA